MEQYLSYEEYAALGGALSEAAFPRAELRARRRLDALTQGRVAGMAAMPEEVKAAMAELIDVDASFGASAQAASPPPVSFAADGYLESYGGASERAELAERQLRACVEGLLYGLTDDEGVPLLYAGIGVRG